ncbi:hypothetical protein ACSBR1_004324 [Camellia fascicularis]
MDTRSLTLANNKFGGHDMDANHEYENKVLCPRMDSVLEKAFMDGRTWNCIVFLRLWLILVENLFMSKMGNKWVSMSGKNLNSFVKPFFHADMYHQAYSFSIGPVLTIEKPMCSVDDALILPPLSKRPTGRLKKNIIAFIGEFKRVMKCSQCGSIGHHNKRTYKEPLLNS